MIHALAMVGAITLAVIAYHSRWIFERAAWKRGTPFLGRPWGGIGSQS